MTKSWLKKQLQTEKIGSLYVVFTTANKFSPICDRLYPYEKLLIYTPNELIYYGKGINSIQKILKRYTPISNIFWGGGINGFIGTVRNRLTTNEILNIVEQIKLLEL